MTTDEATRPNQWWRSAVIYQVYPRSFADQDGDGIGDLRGIAARMPALAELGVDAIWLSPFFTSPQRDAGYDVADYRDVDPLFGTLADFDALLAEAHRLKLRVIADLVPNHTSSDHAWFQEALAASEGSEARDHYLFRDGRGSGGDEPPNNWQSVFGGPAWTRVTRPDGTPGQWYLHLFDTSQPDLNWNTASGCASSSVTSCGLARPWGRWIPHRRRTRPDQGCRTARLHSPGHGGKHGGDGIRSERASADPAVLGAGWRARDLPRLARRARGI